MREMPVAEEQPAAALGLRGPALLDESAERRDACAGTHHDDVLVGRRQREMLVRLDLYAHVVAALEPLGHVVRRNALARAAMAFVTHRRNQQVRLIADFAPGRGDRIGARRKRPRQRTQFLGIERDRKRRDEIDELTANDPFALPGPRRARS